MRKPIVRLLIVVSFAVLVPSVQAAERVPYGNGLIWAVERTGIPTSFIVGTLHIPVSRVQKVMRAATKLLDQVRLLCTELGDVPKEKVGLEMTNDMRLETMPWLDMLLGREDFQRLRKLVGDPMKIPPNRLKRLNPTGAFLLVYNRLLIGNSKEEIFDRALVDAASERGVPNCAIETVSEQSETLTGIDYGLQMQQLRVILRDFENQKEEWGKFENLYRNGNLAAIWKKITGGVAKADRNNSRGPTERIFDRRNTSMTRFVIPHLRKGGVMVAVGAGHLPGNGGILERIAAAGYSLRPLH